MVRKILLSIISLSIFLFSFSQEKIIDYGLSLNVSDRLLAITIHKHDNVVFSHSVLINDDIVTHIYNSGSQKREIIGNTSLDNKNGERIADLYRKAKYLLHHPNLQHTTDILYHKDKMNYYIIRTDAKSNKVQILDTIRRGINADLLYIGTNGDTSTIIHYMKGENAFNIYNITSAGVTTKRTVHIKFANEEKIKIRSVSMKNFMFLPNNTWTPPQLIRKKDLAYLFADHVYLVIDDDDFSSWLVDLDIRTYTAKATRFTYPDYNFHKKKAATMLSGNLLISSFANDNGLCFFFHDIENGRLIDSAILQKGNLPSQFAGIKTVGEFWNRTISSTINFDHFLKKCKRSDIVLTGYNRFNELFLTIAVEADPRPGMMLSNAVTLGAFGFDSDVSLLTLDVSFKLPDFSIGSCDTKSGVWEKLLLSIWSNRERIGDLEFLGDHAYYTIFNLYSKRVAVYRYNLYMP